MQAHILYFMIRWLEILGLMANVELKTFPKVGNFEWKSYLKIRKFDSKFLFLVKVSTLSRGPSLGHNIDRCITKYWQLFIVMVNTLCKMRTINSFQNKQSTRAVTAPLISPIGDAKTVTSSEFPAYRGTNMLCIWGESLPNPPLRPEWGVRGFQTTGA